MHTITHVQYVCMNHFLCVIFTHLYLPQIPQNINTGSSTAKVLDNWNYCIYEKKSLSLSICFERENFEILYKSNFPSMPQFCICTIKHKKNPIDEKSTKRRGMPSDYIYKVIITVLCTQERLHTAGLTAKTWRPGLLFLADK